MQTTSLLLNVMIVYMQPRHQLQSINQSNRINLIGRKSTTLHPPNPPNLQTSKLPTSASEYLGIWIARGCV